MRLGEEDVAGALFGPTDVEGRAGRAIHYWIASGQLDRDLGAGATGSVRCRTTPGGYGRVRNYLRHARPRAAADPVVRFETPPGHQGHMDFGGFRLPGERRHVLLVVLGYSCLMWLRLYPRQKMEVLCHELEGAFERFGACRRSCCSTRYGRWWSGLNRSHALTSGCLRVNSQRHLGLER